MKFDAVLIAGPTASGKSAVALGLAEILGGVVINTDSMQVYRELRVLTARPSPEDEARAPHLLYGHVPVRERYSAGRYFDDATRALAQARAEGRLPIFAGGTGLYFSALTDGLSPIPPVPAELRDVLRQRQADIGATEFYAEFAARDPETAARLRANDTQRVLRAASVFEATGRPLVQWQQTQGKGALDGLQAARFVIAPPRDVLSARIDARFRAMVENGGAEEAALLEGLDPALPAARALGLRQLTAIHEGQLKLEAGIAAGQAETRQYAKRQTTWLRRFMRDWNWFEDQGIGNIISQITQKIA